MSDLLLVGTRDGIHRLPAGERALADHEITALAYDEGGWWALVDDGSIRRSPDGSAWDEVADVERVRPTCLLPTGDGLLVGTHQAHLWRLADGDLRPVESFERVEGRDEWYTPWGGPPDVRSLSADGDAIYVNVHVGGIVRSTDGGASWEPTIDIHSDVHEVRASPLLVAATARGLARSDDGGSRWALEADGLHATYARAVAVGRRYLFISVSEGPRGGRAAVYRRALDGPPMFERCRQGLPEWFPSNIDTGCLDASGAVVAFGTDDGDVFVSDDDGETWTRAAHGLAAVRALAFSR